MGMTISNQVHTYTGERGGRAIVGSRQMSRSKKKRKKGGINNTGFFTDISTKARPKGTLSSKHRQQSSTHRTGSSRFLKLSRNQPPQDYRAYRNRGLALLRLPSLPPGLLSSQKPCAQIDPLEKLRHPHNPS
jgi:hypothetical protein